MTDATKAWCTTSSMIPIGKAIADATIVPPREMNGYEVDWSQLGSQIVHGCTCGGVHGCRGVHYNNGTPENHEKVAGLQFWFWEGKIIRPRPPAPPVRLPDGCKEDDQ